MSVLKFLAAWVLLSIPAGLALGRFLGHSDASPAEPAPNADAEGVRS